MIIGGPKADSENLIQETVNVKVFKNALKNTVPVYPRPFK